MSYSDFVIDPKTGRIADYYATLGVSATADAAEILRSYRKLALKYHPDKNPDPSTAELFKKMTAFKTVLTDDQQRKQYDEAVRRQDDPDSDTDSSDSSGSEHPRWAKRSSKPPRSRDRYDEDEYSRSHGRPHHRQDESYSKRHHSSNSAYSDYSRSSQHIDDELSEIMEALRMAEEKRSSAHRRQDDSDDTRSSRQSYHTSRQGPSRSAQNAGHSSRYVPPKPSRSNKRQWNDMLDDRRAGPIFEDILEKFNWIAATASRVQDSVSDLQEDGDLCIDKARQQRDREAEHNGTVFRVMVHLLHRCLNFSATHYEGLALKLQDIVADMDTSRLSQLNESIHDLADTWRASAKYVKQVDAGMQSGTWRVNMASGALEKAIEIWRSDYELPDPLEEAVEAVLSGECEEYESQQEAEEDADVTVDQVEA